MESSDEEGVDERQFKVILVGDGAVGKTSIASRFTQDQFSKSYKQTIGIDFFIKQLVLPGDVHVALQDSLLFTWTTLHRIPEGIGKLWDIGGQTLGSKMIGKYIWGAHAVLLVYDVSNYQSFANLEDWYALVKRTFSDAELPYVALVANKADLEHLRTVKPEEHTAFAKENAMYSYLLSAKTGDNVASSFYRITADLAGVAITVPQMEVQSAPVPIVVTQIGAPHTEASIGDGGPAGNRGKRSGSGSSRKCAIQ